MNRGSANATGAEVRAGSAPGIVCKADAGARCVRHLVNLDRHQGCAFSGTPTRPAEKSIRWKCRLDLPLQQTRESLGNMQHIHDYPRVDRNGACTDDRDRRSDDDFGAEYLVLGIEPYAEEQAEN
jgi:hypothetical protein